MQSNDIFIKKTLRRYMFPTIFTIAWTTLITFVNHIIIGKSYGETALTGANIVSSIVFLYFMLGCLINIGSSAVASVALGREKYDIVGKYESFAFIASIIFSLIVSAILLIFFEPIMHFMGARGEIYKLIANYGKTMVIFGFVITLMYFPFNFLKLDGRNVTATICFSIMFLMDIVLVLWGIKAGYGVTWVAKAYIISVAFSDLIGCVLLVTYKLTPIKPKLFKKNEILFFTVSVFRVGSSAGLNNLCNMLRTILLNAIIIRQLGSSRAAAFAVVCSIINLTSATVSGCGQTIASMVGVFYGEKDYVSIRFLMKNAIKYAIIIHAVITGLLIIFARPIAHGFGIWRASLLDKTVFDIRIYSLSLILCAILNVCIYYYMTIKVNDIALLVTFGRAFLFVSMFVYVFAFLKLSKFYAFSFLLAELLSFLIMMLMCGRHRKEDQVKGVLLLKDYDETERMISFSVSSTNQGAVEASEKMEEFCMENDVDIKLAMTLPLALEELIVVMNEHCMVGKGSMTDVRILMSKGKVLMRIRCGGRLFDPIAWYKDKLETMTSEELLEDDSLGIRMIVKKSEFVNFSCTFGVNNVIVGM